MRALAHIGLAMALVVVPTFCCCKVRGLGAAVHTAPTSPAPSQLPAESPAPPVESCCVKAKTSCCHIHPNTPKPAPAEQPDSKPMKPTAPAESCVCCGERPDAAQIESKPTVAAPEPTGELLPLAVDALAGSPEYAGAFCGHHPPGRAGIDVRFATLFERHTLRC
jgi:hypothetical protein